MASDFDRVVIKIRPKSEGWFEILLHPFPHLGRTVVMFNSNDVYQGELAEWEKSIVENLWLKIQGIDTLHIKNGMISGWHNGVFDTDKITPIVESFIEPILKEALRAKKLLDKTE